MRSTQNNQSKKRKVYSFLLGIRRARNVLYVYSIILFFMGEGGRLIKRGVYLNGAFI